MTCIDVTVHLISTPVNCRRSCATGRRRSVVELHLLTPLDLPLALHTTKHLPTGLMLALKRACDLAAPRFGTLLVGDPDGGDGASYKSDRVTRWRQRQWHHKGVAAAAGMLSSSTSEVGLALTGLRRAAETGR